MADKKLTQLPSGSALDNSDIFPFVSGSTTTPETKFIRTDNLRESLLINDLFDYAQTGWILDSDEWVYVSATSFKIEGKDVRTRFPTGTKIKLTQTTTKYFYVVSTAYSTDTTITITGGSDYSLADATITDNFYSYAATPQSFPRSFSWTPTWTGLTVTGSPITTGKYWMSDATVFFTIHINPNGGTTASTSGTYVNNPPVTPTMDGSFTGTKIAAPSTITSPGNIWATGSGRFYTPPWTENNGYFVFSGNYK